MSIELEALKTQIALKTIESLPEEVRNEILAKGVMAQLERINVGYEVRGILEKEALVFAKEYAQRPEIQEVLKEKAHKAVDDILAGILKNIGRSIESDIKNNYSRILSDKAYGER